MKPFFRHTLTLGCAVAVTACLGGQVGSQEVLTEGDSAEQPIIGGARADGYAESALIDMTLATGRAACSGTVIAPKVAITAGHCVHGVKSWKVTVPYAGKQSATSSDGAVFDYTNDSDTVDPKQHDVGLVFLSTPITLPSYPAIAAAPVPDGTQGMDIGRIDNGKLSNSDLFVAPISLRNASRSGYPFDYVSPVVIQPGDSGGPVMATGAAPHTLLAVNSGAGGSTQVVARVDLVKTWIDQQIAAHGGGGSPGGSDGGTPPPGDAGTPAGSTACTGTSVPSSDQSFATAVPLQSSMCGTLAAGAQSWFTFSLASAGVAYELKLDTRISGGTLRLFKKVRGSWSRVQNTSAIEISHTSSGPGDYALAVFSTAGESGAYALSARY